MKVPQGFTPFDDQGPFLEHGVRAGRDSLWYRYPKPPSAKLGVVARGQQACERRHVRPDSRRATSSDRTISSPFIPGRTVTTAS